MALRQCPYSFAMRYDDSIRGTRFIGRRSVENTLTCTFPASKLPEFSESVMSHALAIRDNFTGIGEFGLFIQPSSGVTEIRARGTFDQLLAINERTVTEAQYALSSEHEIVTVLARAARSANKRLGASTDEGGAMYAIDGRYMLKIYSGTRVDSFIQEMAIYGVLSTLPDVRGLVTHTYSVGVPRRPVNRVKLFYPFFEITTNLNTRNTEELILLHDACRLLAAKFDAGNMMTAVKRLINQEVKIIYDAFTGVVFVAGIFRDGVIYGHAEKDGITEEQMGELNRDYEWLLADVEPVPPIDSRVATEYQIKLLGAKHQQQDGLYNGPEMQPKEPGDIAGVAVFDLVQGEELEDFCQLPGINTRQLLLEVVERMAVLHRNGIVHCDLHTGQIMVRSETDLVILDFDRSALLPSDDAGGQEFRTTTHWEQIYSKEYFQLAPEFDDRANVSRASDVFSMGSIIYRVCMRGVELPFNHEFALLPNAGIEDGMARLPTGVLSPNIRRVIAACRQLDPSQRPTMKELHALLSEIFEAEF